MPNFEKSVGNSGFNLKHDVALLQACLKLLGVWEGRIDGEWSSNKAALEQRILLLEAHLKTKTLNRAQISPGSNFTNALKRKLPSQYQSLEGIKGTPCLTIDDSNASRIRELMVKDLILPDACKQDIEKLQQDMKKALGLDLIIVEVRPDSLGYCILKLAPRNKACLDANLKPIPINGETPKDVKDIIDRKVNVLGQLRRVSTRRGIEVSTDKPVHKPEAVRAFGPGASMAVPALSDNVLSGPVGTSGNKLEDVALVQAAFSMIASPEGHRLWNRGVSGSAGTTLTEAIKEFQMSYGMKRTGIIEPGSNEEATMINALHPRFRHMRCAPGTTAVFCSTNPDVDIEAIVRGTEQDPDLDPDQRQEIAALQREAAKQTGICLVYDKQSQTDRQAARHGKTREIVLKCADVIWLDKSGKPQLSGDAAPSDPKAMEVFAKISPAKRKSYRIERNSIVYTEQTTERVKISSSGKKIPPIAPLGVDIDANIREAKSRWNPFWFYNQVRNSGPWDYKQLDKEKYEDFGNFHYGAVGAAMGFSDTTLLNAAGFAQWIAGTQDDEENWGDPGLLPILGTGSYGDDPADQFWIKHGIDFYNNRSHWEKPPQE